MADYTETHASALADLAEAGAAVTFTRTSQTYTDADDTIVPTSTTIPGYAIRSRGNPLKYQALGLIQSENPTLFFAPTTFDDIPLPGDKVTWDSIVYTAKDIEPLSPNGQTIAARIVISR